MTRWKTKASVELMWWMQNNVFSCTAFWRCTLFPPLIVLPESRRYLENNLNQNKNRASIILFCAGKKSQGKGKQCSACLPALSSDARTMCVSKRGAADRPFAA